MNLDGIVFFEELEKVYAEEYLKLLTSYVLAVQTFPKQVDFINQLLKESK